MAGCSKDSQSAWSSSSGSRPCPSSSCRPPGAPASHGPEPPCSSCCSTSGFRVRKKPVFKASPAQTLQLQTCKPYCPYLVWLHRLAWENVWERKMNSPQVWHLNVSLGASPGSTAVLKGSDKGPITGFHKSSITDLSGCNFEF